MQHSTGPPDSDKESLLGHRVSSAAFQKDKKHVASWKSSSSKIPEMKLHRNTTVQPIRKVRILLYFRLVMKSLLSSNVVLYLIIQVIIGMYLHNMDSGSAFGKHYNASSSACQISCFAHPVL